MTPLTLGGITTTITPGEFKVGIYRSLVDLKVLVQWDYRDYEGVLHTGVAPTLNAAKLAAKQFGYKGE